MALFIEIFGQILAETICAILYMYMMYKASPFRKVGMSCYYYTKAAWYSTVASVISSFSMSKYETKFALGDTIIYNNYVVSEYPGLIHFPIASPRDATGAVIKTMFESTFGEGFPFKKTVPALLPLLIKKKFREGVFKIEIE